MRCQLPKMNQIIQRLLIILLKNSIGIKIKWLKA